MKTKYSPSRSLGELIVVLAVLVLLALFALPQTAQADVGTKNFSITNSIAANGTVTSAANVGTAVKIDNRDNCSLVFSAAGSTAQNGNLTFTFVRSADNVTWETQPTFTWVVPLNNLTPIVAWTNFPQAVIGSAGYIKCISIANANTTALATNASLKLVDKVTK